LRTPGSGEVGQLRAEALDAFNSFEPDSLVIDLFGEHVREHTAVPVQLRPRLFSSLRTD